MALDQILAMTAFTGVKKKNKEEEKEVHFCSCLVSPCIYPM